jgi:hypothetical protein
LKAQQVKKPLLMMKAALKHLANKYSVQFLELVAMSTSFFKKL